MKPPPDSHALEVPVPLLWNDPDVSSDEFIGVWDWQGSTHYLEFRQGRIWEGSPEPLIKFHTSAHRLAALDVLASTGLTPIVNGRAAGVLMDAAGSDAQMVPVKVVSQDGEIGPYWVVNSTRLVTCIDYGASVVTMMPGAPDKLLGLKRLHLRPDCMDTAQLAREADYHSILYVAPPLAATLRAAKLRGLNLLTPEEAFAHWV